MQFHSADMTHRPVTVLMMAVIAALLFLLSLGAVIVPQAGAVEPELHAQVHESFDEALHESIDTSAEVEGGDTIGITHDDDHMATHEGDDHGEAHGEGGLPQFDVTTFPSQLFWLAVTFAIMYLVFSSKTLPALSGVIENRREHIQNDLETAERMRNEAEGVKTAYEDKLDFARKEANRMMTEASTGVQKIGEEKNNALREQNEKDVVALEARLTKETEKAMEDMNAIAAEIAHEAADKVFGIQTDLKKAKTVVQSLKSEAA